MIQIQNVTKTFQSPGGGEVQALAAVSLWIGQGEFLAVVGASGSGKSTLLFTVGGVSAPTSGSVRLGERFVYDLPPSERAALRRTDVGFVFQTFNLVPYLTTLENVMLPALLQGRSRPDAEAAAMGLLERLGIATRRAHRPSQLSVGERQRAGIARSLVNGPKVLLADEPTGNLDPVAAAQVIDLFRELNDEGQTLVMVTHDPLLAERARRVVRLEAGAVREDRPGREQRRAS
ncbi:MAG TPA: ABC transporter ATP-binding protein [Anaeromyxobacteraceae bacterium]|nr:ABC transporter ATP-binding protein [Anaeromyxobacteraceae bacterium]